MITIDHEEQRQHIMSDWLAEIERNENKRNPKLLRVARWLIAILLVAIVAAVVR